MIRQYIDEALHRASYSVVDGNLYRATVAGLADVIATQEDYEILCGKPNR